MRTVYSELHQLRAAQTELFGGQLVAPFECPARAEIVRARIEAVGLGPIEPPRSFADVALLTLHDAGYLAFLEGAFAAWQAAGFQGEAIASNWPARRMRVTRPEHIDGQLGYYALAAETSITAGTWPAARASAAVALTAASLLAEGERAAFALCRPPGHHATSDMYGGYCFLNNAALAAQHLRDQGAGKVAILDVDFHHGNGTQDLFYRRGDVLFLSLHGDPRHAFPYFLGHADETGEGDGEGCTQNYPLPPGTAYAAWSAALEDALTRCRRFGAEALVVSLGVDTFERDPISFFKLASDDFSRYGARLATLGLPTLFVMEGGYAVAEIGLNLVNVLTGFAAGRTG